jgi:hypothetical protein
VRANRPVDFAGVPDPTFIIEPHPCRGWWIVYAEQCDVSTRVAVKIGRKRAEKLAVRYLRDYRRWKNRVLTKTALIDGQEG